MDALASIFELLAAGCIVVAMICDLRRFEIPDALSVAIVALFIGFALTTAAPVSWLDVLPAPVLVFAAGLLLFWRGWMGGGDVKLLTAISFWTGLSGLPMLLAGTMIAGGVLAAVLLALRALPVADGARRSPMLEKNGPLPYAVAIGAGVAAWALLTPGVVGLGHGA